MNNKEFIAELSSRTGYTKVFTQQMMDDLLIAMSDCFIEGDSVAVAGFGARHRESHNGSNHVGAA